MIAAVGSALARPPWPLLMAVSAAGWMLLAVGDGEAGAVCGAVSGSLGAWALMVVAMTPPLLAHPLRRVWRSSLARRRGAAVALFVAGYGGVWLAAGLAFVSVTLPMAVVLVLAVAWRVAPGRAALMTACHRAPMLRSFGRGAFVDCFGYGVRFGGACVGVCWPLMLLPLAVPGWHLAVMAAAMAAMLVERHGVFAAR